MISISRIGLKIAATVAIAVCVGLTASVLFYSKQQESSILRQNALTTSKLTNSITEVLQAIMLTGNGDLARALADHLKHLRGVDDLRIVRTDGLEAFRDNKTIENVNKRRGDEEFIPRDEVEVIRALPVGHGPLTQAVSSQKTVTYYETAASGERVLTFLAPMLAKKDCAECHGKKEAVRGLIKITTSLRDAQADIAASQQQALGVMMLTILLVLLVTALVLRRLVALPIGRVTEAVRRVSGGNLTEEVPKIGHDEIGQMAESFNAMIKQVLQTYSGLQSEQDKLTTLILGARDGIVVTDKSDVVVLVNPSAEVLLEKDFSQIVHEGFPNLVNDPKLIRGLLEAERGQNESLQIEYKERVLILRAATIRSNDGDAIGSAALIRDVTARTRMENELRKLATIDALTGLYNRRYLDERLQEELQRAGRYGQPLAVLLFDADHFKHFNDEHGHEQGDRVLQALGREVRSAVRDVDVPCRYGGEEFMVILPNTNAGAAQMVAERLRKRVAETLVDGLSVTISIGVAETLINGTSDPEGLVKLADTALYAAKENGRNCVQLAPAAEHSQSASE